jgi:methylmalonyl-CoA mutase C-terminal domain/subunit
MEQKTPIRVLIAKVGLDGHDRGAKVVVLGLREQGMEVIYSGLRQTPEQVVQRVLKENVDVIGLSSLSGEHNSSFPQIVELARRNGMDRILIIGGGIIPPEDIPFLYKKGISAIFGPGTLIQDIADYIRGNIER